MPYLTPNSYQGISDIPVNLPETELRRGKFIRVASISLAIGQSLQFKSLSLHLIAVLTPGVTPILLNSRFGLCIAGLYISQASCSPIGMLTLKSPGVISLNPFYPRSLRSPGDYFISIVNNASNVDLSVSLTGAVKFYG